MKYVRIARNIAQSLGVRKPIWTVEINYGIPTSGAKFGGQYPEQKQIAYVIGTFALSPAYGVKRVYWLGWGNYQTMAIALTETDLVTVSPAGLALARVRTWMRSYTHRGCARARTGVWTCTLTGRSGGRLETRRIVWHGSGTRYVKAPAGSFKLQRGTGQSGKIRGGKRVKINTVPTLFRSRRWSGGPVAWRQARPAGQFFSGCSRWCWSPVRCQRTPSGSARAFSGCTARTGRPRHPPSPWVLRTSPRPERTGGRCSAPRDQPPNFRTPRRAGGCRPGRDARPLVILGATPDCGDRPGALRRPLRERSQSAAARAWRTYVRQVATRYGKTIDYQVWPEPNIRATRSGGAEYMGTLTMDASRVIREVAPGARVLPGPAVLRLEGERQWFLKFISSRPGGMPLSHWVDAFTLDPYPNNLGTPEASSYYIAWAQRQLRQRGVDKPVWNVEINYGIGPGGVDAHHILERQAAAWVARTFLNNARLRVNACSGSAGSITTRWASASWTGDATHKRATAYAVTRSGWSAVACGAARCDAGSTPVQVIAPSGVNRVYWKTAAPTMSQPYLSPLHARCAWAQDRPAGVRRIRITGSPIMVRSNTLTRRTRCAHCSPSSSCCCWAARSHPAEAGPKIRDALPGSWGRVC